MRRAAGLTLVVVSLLLSLGLASHRASARPVRVGRYTEIPYGVPEEPWVTAGGGPLRNGRSRFSAPTEAPTRAWETRLRSSRPSAPVLVGDEVLYVATSTGIVALATDGTVRWSQRLGFVASTPALSPTHDLVVGTNAGALVTLAADGQRRGRTLVGGAVRSSPLVLHDGSVVVSAFDQAVHRFDAEGRRVFRVSMNGQTNQPAAWTTDGLLLVPAADWLHVLSPRGDRIASYSVGATIIAGPAVADDGTAWVVAQDGWAHRLEPRGGRRSRTELDIRVASDTELAIGADGAVRIPGRNDGIVCLGPTGTERWRVVGEGGFPGELTVDTAGVTLATSDTGRLLAIDPGGNVVWRVSLEARAQAAPVLGPDGTIYVATARGTIQAWR